MSYISYSKSEDRGVLMMTIDSFDDSFDNDDW